MDQFRVVKSALELETTKLLLIPPRGLKKEMKVFCPHKRSYSVHWSTQQEQSNFSFTNSSLWFSRERGKGLFDPNPQTFFSSRNKEVLPQKGGLFGVLPLTTLSSLLVCPHLVGTGRMIWSSGNRRGCRQGSNGRGSEEKK